MHYIGAGEACMYTKKTIPKHNTQSLLFPRDDAGDMPGPWSLWGIASSWTTSTIGSEAGGSPLMNPLGRTS
jgi:hypothetical protein